MQPASLIFMLGGVDADSLPMIRHARQGVNYHDLAIREVLERLRESDPSIPLFDGPWYCGVLERGVVLVNMTRSYADMADNREQTRTEFQMCEEVHLFSRLLKENVPAFKDSFLIQTATQTGIRETRRIKGAYTLTGEDYINAVDFPDAISRGCHPVDIHSAFPVYIMPNLGRMLFGGAKTHRLAFLFACYRHYLKYKVDDCGTAFKVDDPWLNEADWAVIDNGKAEEFLGISPFEAVPLSEYPTFVGQFLSDCDALTSGGDRPLIKKINT